MEVRKKVSAGVAGKNDMRIDIEPADSLVIDINSSVMSIFGYSIEESIRSALRKAEIYKAHVSIEDRGALPWIVNARIEAAIVQLMEE